MLLGVSKRGAVDDDDEVDDDGDEEHFDAPESGNADTFFADPETGLSLSTILSESSCFDANFGNAFM